MDSVEGLIERIAAKVGHGVSVEDLDGLLIAYSSNQSDADPVRVQFLLSKRVPTPVARWQRSHGIASALRPVVVPANEELSMSSRVFAPLLEHGFRVGSLWVQCTDSADIPLVLDRLQGCSGELAELSRLILDTSTGETEHRRARERVFLQACQGNVRARGELREWPQIHGSGPWQVAVMTLLEPSPGEGGGESGRESFLRVSSRLALTDQDPALAHRVAALQATLGVDPAIFSAGDSTHAVVLYSLRDISSHGLGVPPSFHARIARSYAEGVRARTSISSARVFTGLSEPLRDLGSLASGFQEALAALQAAAVDPLVVCGDLGSPTSASAGDFGGPDPVFSTGFRDIGIYQFLASTRGAAHSSASLGFRELVDDPEGETLIRILELLYERQSSVGEVAGMLHMHRSSVYNKLSKVRRILGSDPLGGGTRLELHFAIKAARWDRRPRL